MVETAKMMNSGDIILSFDLYELDFGWGKLVWFYYCNLKVVNIISLCDTGAGGGIQAVVSLSAQEMAILESDPELLAIASINLSPL